jgi:protein O-mannosyl-transferase
MNSVTSRLACGLAVVVACLVYVNALPNPFIYDDYRAIVENRAMADSVVAVSYAIDRAVWGSGPFGFHLTNVLLHMVNVALFGWLAWRVADDHRRRARDPSSAARPEVVAPVAASLFAVHPMLAGAVGYVSARPELLCAMFVLLASLAARRWMNGRGGLWRLATVALFFAAIGSADTAVLFPAMALAYDRWILVPADAAESRRRLAWLHAPLFALAAVLAATRLVVFVLVERSGIIDFQGARLFAALDIARQFGTMLVVPAGQSIFHAVAPVAGWLQPRSLADLSVFAFAGWLIVSQRRVRPLLSFGLTWFLVFLVPASVLVLLNPAEAMVEHRVYLASCGVFLVAGSAFDRVWALLATARRATQVVVVAGLIAVIATFGQRTVLRNALWGHPVLVWLDAAERAPTNWLPHRVLGEELHRAGQHAQAIAAFTRAVELAPLEVSTYGKLGVCLTEQGDLAAAEAVFTKMRALDARSPEASNGLATLAMLRGNLEAARRGYLETLVFDATNLSARRGLAVIAEAPGGNAADALRWCQEIKRIDPAAPGIDDCISRNQAKAGGGGSRDKMPSESGR